MLSAPPITRRRTTSSAAKFAGFYPNLPGRLGFPADRAFSMAAGFESRFVGVSARGLAAFGGDASQVAEMGSRSVFLSGQAAKKNGEHPQRVRPYASLLANAGERARARNLAEIASTHMLLRGPPSTTALAYLSRYVNAGKIRASRARGYRDTCWVADIRWDLGSSCHYWQLRPYFHL